MINFPEIMFYFLATVLLFAGLRVITARNPVHAALFLVLAFFTGSALWVMLEAEFLAITLVLVYVGAVMVLFLFVVMMLDINIDKIREGFWDYLPMAAFVGILMAIEMVMVLGGRHLAVDKGTSPHPAGYSNTEELGSLLYTDYVYAFEIAAAVLLVAIISAIALTLRHRSGRKNMDASEQVKVRSEDCIRIIRMPTELGATVDEPQKIEGGGA